MAKKKSRRKNQPEANIDLTALILIIIGIVLSFIIYTTEKGSVGGFIDKMILHGLVGKLTIAIPIIFIFLGIYIIFRDYSRLKLKAFQIILLIVSVAALITAFEYPFVEGNEAENIIDAFGKLYVLGVNGQGGGILGALLAVPLIEGFGMLVAKVIIISIILVITVLVTGITFSSIIIGIKDWICDMIEAKCSLKPVDDDVVELKHH